MLASQRVAGAQIGDGFVGVDFTRPTNVASGQQYAIAIVPVAGNSCNARWNRGDTGYTGGAFYEPSGATWTPRDALDGRFRTFVDPIAAGCTDGAGDSDRLVAALELASTAPGADTVTIYDCTYTLDAVDNHWYGPNALPEISSTITIEGNGATIERSSAGATPSFRFFFVGADPASADTLNYTSPGPGVLTLRDLTLSNGRAEGGDAASFGGGGAGMGGAIFNQGIVTLEGVTATANRAVGGAGATGFSSGGGGGIGTDASPSAGGGFGPGTFGGASGGLGAAGGGGGGAGFRTGENGANATGSTGGAGGGPASGLGGGGYSSADGPGAVAGGNGSGGGAGGFGTGGNGGGFGFGGQSGLADPGGGGGVGGGGGGYGGGGGFGGGGAYRGDGGFGGGAGAVVGTPPPGDRDPIPGFGGGAGGRADNPGVSGGGGGAGMGGAIFNHRGVVTVTRSTLSGNAAVGGAGGGDANVAGARGADGSGRGGAIFNLNGTVNGTAATIAVNTAADGGGAIYNLSYNSAEAVTARVNLNNALMADTAGGATDFYSIKPTATTAGSNHAGAVADFNFDRVLVESLDLSGSSALVMDIVINEDPALRPLADNGGLTQTHGIGRSSPAVDAGEAFAQTADQRGEARTVDHPGVPNSLGAGSDGTDIGAYELQDVTDPALTISGGPTGLTADQRPTFTFNAEAGATLRCSIDTGTATYGPCSGAAAHTPAADLPDGAHTFRVEATDAAGNQTVRTRSFNVDATPPALTIDSGPTAATNDPRPSFGFSAEAGATVRCSIDTGTASFGPCSGAASHTPAANLPEGAHTFRVEVTDAAGNQTLRTRSFTVDTTPPALTIDSGPTGATSDSRPTFEFSAEAGATVECSIDGGTADYGPCSGASSHRPDSDLADGAYTFRVRARDAAGNESEQTRTFAVDTAPDRECKDHPVTIYAVPGVPTKGTDGPDVIYGTAGSDEITAGEGDDIVCALNDEDVVEGGGGSDLLAAGGGDDIAEGAAGADELRGGAGADRVFGGSGSDRVRGQAGGDRLSGQGGDDVLRGGADRDRLDGGVGTNELFGGGGRDTCVSGPLLHGC